ncbi:hypothetical protein ACP26L_15730 [Paenibacillus sp. S-38]|uniref:hypothetical protein n=1 Tax=Paenibacillus sp. S-38 TaxID=3416710 RepID=UPI003CF4D02D
MTEQYRFFGSTEGDVREYNQLEFAEVFDRFFQTGIFPRVGEELKVLETDPQRLAVRVNTGQAWLRGYWYRNDEIYEIELPPAHPEFPRIHRIVVRLDTLNQRNILAIAKAGEPSATPVAPALEQNEEYWEIGLADVYVAAGVTKVDASNITDIRYSGGGGKAVGHDFTDLQNLADQAIAKANASLPKDGSQPMTGALRSAVGSASGGRVHHYLGSINDVFRVGIGLDGDENGDDQVGSAFTVWAYKNNGQFHKTLMQIWRDGTAFIDGKRVILADSGGSIDSATIKNSTINDSTLYNPRLLWDRDSDYARLEFVDEGANKDILTLTVGDDAQGSDPGIEDFFRLRFGNDTVARFRSQSLTVGEPGSGFEMYKNGDLWQRGELMAPTRVRGGVMEYWDGERWRAAGMSTIVVSGTVQETVHAGGADFAGGGTYGQRKYLVAKHIPKGVGEVNIVLDFYNNTNSSGGYQGISIFSPLQYMYYSSDTSGYFAREAYTGYGPLWWHGYGTYWDTDTDNLMNQSLVAGAGPAGGGTMQANSWTTMETTVKVSSKLPIYVLASNSLGAFKIQNVRFRYDVL